MKKPRFKVLAATLPYSDGIRSSSTIAYVKSSNLVIPFPSYMTPDEVIEVVNAAVKGGGINRTWKQLCAGGYSTSLKSDFVWPKT